MTAIAIVKASVGLAAIIIGVLNVVDDVKHYLMNKKLDKQLKQDFINKTGVYSYLKK